MFDRALEFGVVGVRVQLALRGQTGAGFEVVPLGLGRGGDVQRAQPQRLPHGMVLRVRDEVAGRHSGCGQVGGIGRLLPVALADEYAPTGSNTLA